MAPKPTVSPDESWHEEARLIRLHNTIRRRWLSFISVFAVGCVAVLLLMYSVRWRATPCQFRAKNVELILFTKPTYTPAMIRSSASDVLSMTGFRMSPPANKSALGTMVVEQHSFLDTNTRQLRESSLELRYSLRSSVEKRYPYEYMLRYISQDMCLDRPPFPLGAEYNVDEEYTTRATKAVSDTETTFYFFQSSIRTATRNKMKVANDVAVSFPSMRGVMMSGPLVASESCQTSAVDSGRVYFSKSGSALPSMAIKTEEWKCCDHATGSCRSFNTLRVVHRALEEEVVATTFYRTLKSRIDSEGGLCSSGDCGVPLYQA